MQRYLPSEHHLPEKAVRGTVSLVETTDAAWLQDDGPWPIELLEEPEPIEVSAPIPDYPPMLFIYKGQVYRRHRADGPKRIEQEWWVQPGLHRDYYHFEDDTGRRYWIFRLGHYDPEKTGTWFIHGFFA